LTVPENKAIFDSSRKQWNFSLNSQLGCFKMLQKNPPLPKENPEN
jgi:hypothetical protein